MGHLENERANTLHGCWPRSQDEEAAEQGSNPGVSDTCGHLLRPRLCVPGARGSAAPGLSRDSSSQPLRAVPGVSPRGLGGDSQVPAPVTGCAVACRGLCQSALGLPRPDGSGHVQRQRLVTRPAGASPRHGDAAEGAAGGGPRRTPARGWAHPRLVCRMGNGCEQVDRPATSSSSPTAPEAPGARRHLPAEDSQER